MKTLTVFTPTYNRKHTLPRTYESLCRQTCRDFDWLVIDDGSSDGTREWIESLGPKMIAKGQKFDWMGRVNDDELQVTNYELQSCSDHFFIQTPSLLIEYIYKPNGGLYTGYNVAYQTIQTELCICIDSDDYMPDDAVEKILLLWKKHYPEGSLNHPLSAITYKEYCGIEGLDFDINTNLPIGGFFPSDLVEACKLEVPHHGDTKQVLRTDLMRVVAPMIGFEGEKNFNPIYMIINVCDRYPLLILNENLCTVEYQIGADSMSQGIFRQYVNSPRSFAKMRLQEMNFIHNSFKGRFRSAIHYVSSCIIARDGEWLKKSNRKFITLLASPFGVLLYLYIKSKS